ncbi:uncharacterized protein [Littorina saxatilis]|uniref:Uncharacterized protein n=1 Tax=Littorina saxatilis TaxID=31220 RepID=A0AAN9ANH6_9CAEN
MLQYLMIFSLQLAAYRGLEWSERFQDTSKPLEICSGENIQLFWNYTLTEGEGVKGLVWTCQPEGKVSELMATYADHHFVPMSPFSGRLAHLKDGGIELSCATILESGNYSVAVTTVDQTGTETLYQKTAWVKIVDTPKTQSGYLEVSKSKEPVRDESNGQWHIQLTCGNFSDRGHPPIDVVWRTPKGEELSSSNFDNGNFQLMIPNPLAGGNYTCSLPRGEPATKCLPRDSELLEEVCVEVDEDKSRFSMLEARQQELLEMMNAKDDHLLNYFATVSSKTDILEARFDEGAENCYSQPVNFHARLTYNTKLLNGNVLKLPIVSTNQGGGYNASTGYFTAPQNGTYFFIGTTGGYSSSNYANMGLEKEGTSLSRTFIALHGSYYNMGSCHATVYLTQGERVWLQSSATSFFRAAVTSFSGFRI